MNRQQGVSVRGGTDWELATVLGDLRHRRLLAFLREQSRSVTVRDLAVRLAAHESDIEPSMVPEPDAQLIVADLEHRCLPKLEAAGLIERDKESVVAVEPLPIETDLSLPPLSKPEDSDWEPISALVARPVRQAVVAELAGQEHRITVEELVAQLCTQPRYDRVTVPDDGQRLRTQLHHVALPKLATLALVAYDPAAQTAARARRTMAIARRTGLNTTPDDETPS